MKKILLIVSLLICISTYTQPQKGANQENTTGAIYRELEVADGCFISIPNDWIEIPQDILQKQTEYIAEEFKTEAPRYDHAYQPDSLSDWFNYPYLLITYYNVGKIPETEFSSFKKMEDSFDECFNELEENSDKLISNTKLEARFYDEKDQVVYFFVSSVLFELIPLYSIVALKLTSNGYLQIQAISIKDDFSSYQDIFETIIKNIKLDKNLLYTPPVSSFEQIVRGPNLKYYLLAIIFIIAGLIRGIIKSKRNNKKSF